MKLVSASNLSFMKFMRNDYFKIFVCDICLVSAPSLRNQKETP